MGVVIYVARVHPSVALPSPCSPGSELRCAAFFFARCICRASLRTAGCDFELSVGVVCSSHVRCSSAPQIDGMCADWGSSLKHVRCTQSPTRLAAAQPIGNASCAYSAVVESA
jgi:hypothetical protein